MRAAGARLAILLFLLIIPTRSVSADEVRGFSVEAAGGSIVNFGGGTASASLAYSFTSHLSASVSGQFTQIPAEVKFYERGYSAERGGTSRFVSGELRVHLLPARRVSPYAIVGAGFGTSSPSVNQYFPEAVTNQLHVVFTGGGAAIRLNPHLSVIGDVRFQLQSERGEVALLTPLRAGIAWRF